MGQRVGLDVRSTSQDCRDYSRQPLKIRRLGFPLPVGARLRRRHHAAAATSRRRFERMSRLLLALALTGIGVSAVCAKDLCIQVDTGSYSGSQIVLKKVKIAPGTAAPLQGYVAIYRSITFSY